MFERYTTTVRAEALSPELAAALPQRPVAGTRYRVTMEEVEETDDEKRETLRAVLLQRRAQVAAGQCVDGEAALAALHAKHFPVKLALEGPALPGRSSRPGFRAPLRC